MRERSPPRRPSLIGAKSPAALCAEAGATLGLAGRQKAWFLPACDGWGGALRGGGRDARFGGRQKAWFLPACLGWGGALRGDETLGQPVRRAKKARLLRAWCRLFEQVDAVQRARPQVAILTAAGVR